MKILRAKLSGNKEGLSCCCAHSLLEAERAASRRLFANSPPGIICAASRNHSPPLSAVPPRVHWIFQKKARWIKEGFVSSVAKNLPAFTTSLSYSKLRVCAKSLLFAFCARVWFNFSLAEFCGKFLQLTLQITWHAKAPHVYAFSQVNCILFPVVAKYRYKNNLVSNRSKSQIKILT